MRLLRLGVVVFVAGAAIAGCSKNTGATDGGPNARNRGVGQACTSSADCRGGLVCGMSATCEPCHCNMAGATCKLSGECMDGLYCAPSGNCETAGTADLTGNCSTTADCRAGLICGPAGFSAQCQMAGRGDIDAMCSGTRDCLAGLQCSNRGTCAIGIGAPAIPAPSLWTGVECPADDVTPRAYFVVPRGDAMADGDFFRLPFPNDIRGGAGTPSWMGFPHPGTDLLPVDLVGEYAEAATGELDGWGTNQAVFFRFSQSVKFESVHGGDDMWSAAIIDLDPTSPDYRQQNGLAWLVNPGHGRYICSNYVAVRPLLGYPLAPRTTYAVILTTAVRTDDGLEYQRDPDFVAMLGSSVPTDATLARAYAAYAPLRRYVTDSGRDPSTILSAAVFTTQDARGHMQRFRDVVRAQPAPVLSDLTVCRAGVTSPCDDGLMGDEHQRGCFAEDPDFTEIQGHVTVPIFQQGTEPYETVEDGGGIEYGADGAPRVARTEQVCFALMIPKTPPPPEGWPLAIYGHGTGGSFRSAVGSGIAAALASGTPNIAVLAIDEPAHGARRGMSSRPSTELFFNFTNPHAARDNIVQGAAELFQLVRVAETFHADATGSPTGSPIAFDPAHVLVYAHSQGATHASLFLPYEPLVTAAILSGNGGDLLESLLHKRQPIDIASVVPAVLADPGPNPLMPSVDDFHPALQLFGAYFASVDPLNYAALLDRPDTTSPARPHVFATYGLGDTYAPVETLQAYLRPSGLARVAPVLETFGGVADVTAPASGNRDFDGTLVSRYFRQYMPGMGDDGHFVAWKTTQGMRDTIGFLQDAARGEVPTIAP